MEVVVLSVNSQVLKTSKLIVAIPVVCSPGARPGVEALIGAVRRRSAGGELLQISTSALPALENTRNFYARRGYHEAGRTPDFYGPEDDKVTFVKVLVERSDVGAMLQNN